MNFEYNSTTQNWIVYYKLTLSIIYVGLPTQS